MNMTKRKIATGLLVIAAAGGTAANLGCSNQLNDLGGINQAVPDYALTYLNVDGFPNVTMLCLRGQAFATTTRAGVDILRWPEQDGFCATQRPANGEPVPATSSNTGH